jgi:hypothetical protein
MGCLCLESVIVVDTSKNLLRVAFAVCDARDGFSRRPCGPSGRGAPPGVSFPVMRVRGLRLCYRLFVMLSGSANARKFF